MHKKVNIKIKNKKNLQKAECFLKNTWVEFETLSIGIPRNSKCIWVGNQTHVGKKVIYLLWRKISYSEKFVEKGSVATDVVF